MRKPNRLINEKSPYLLQHAHNPVDWFPWCDEAFEKAKKEDKPVFLSVGYSTCHWCHVMEKESFEDEEIARILNENFVSIKVDREERPDVDALYMGVCQMMTGSGGWPLTVVMTPDKKPFFAGTYFPKESVYGRAGLKDILLRIAQLWKEEREKVLRSADEVMRAVSESAGESFRGAELGEVTIHRAYGNLLANYDEELGGFGSAPKFPIPHNLMFLMRYFRRTGKERALEMVVRTLERMRLGGIWDHVGFGFHRYSTDREWILPHFEKMLYDNALLIYPYTEAYLITGREDFARVVEEIIEFLKRDMLSPEGGFYSAWDADSEGEEGKFYLWSIEELEKVLSKEELNLAVKIFSLEEEGNFLEEATRRKTGRNVLYMRKPPGEIAKELGVEEDVLRQRIEEIRVRLFKERERRQKPLRDEKILTDWNGLVIGALARAGSALGRDDFVQMAVKCAEFILKNLYPEGKLLHRWKDGEAKVPAFLEDYAFLIWGLTELYFSTFEERYLREAQKLTREAIDKFRDGEGGAFFQTSQEHRDIPVRKKEIYDGAIPSGNSVMAYNLIRLSRLLEDPSFEEHSRDVLDSFSAVISSYPDAHTFSLIALDLMVNGTFELKGEGESAREELLKLGRSFLPEGVFYLKNTAEGGGCRYYLCKNGSCLEPVGSVEELIPHLGEVNL